MATILQGVTDSIIAFLQPKMPEPGAEGIDVVGLAEQARVSKQKLEKEQKDLSTFYANSQAVNEVYQYVSADAKSLSAGTSSVRKVLANKNEYFLAQLGKLDEGPVAGLGPALIGCSKDTGMLEKNFQDISEILNSLHGDLAADPKKDYAYEQLYEQLAAMDKAKAAASEIEIPKEETLIGRLNAFDPIATEQKLSNLKGNIKSLYSSLINISLKYQNVVPYFDQVKVLQGRLAAAIAALEKDLTASSDAAVVLATADLAALQSKEKELQQVLLVQSCLKDIAEKKNEEAQKDPSLPNKPKEGNTPKEAVDPADPLAGIKREIVAAKKTLDANKIKQQTYQEDIDNLKNVLGMKDDFNDKLKVHLEALKGTKQAGLDLKEEITELQLCINGMVDALYPLQEKMMTDGSVITSGFLAELKTLSTIREQITKLNEGISQVTTDGDIKVYFNEIVTTLEGFPEPIKKVADNSIQIEHTLTDLKSWAEALKADVSDALLSALEKSTLNFKEEQDEEALKSEKEDAAVIQNSKSGGKAKKGGATTKEGNTTEDEGQRIDELIQSLKEQTKTDEMLNFPSGEIPVKNWEKEYKKESSAPKGANLAEWQAFFTEKVEETKADDEVQNKKIEFLSQLSPELAAV